MPTRRVNNLAFTLIELLLVMLIITIMIAVIAPNLRGFMAGRGASDAGRTIVSMARYARTAAISEGRIYRLNVDPATRAVWLTAQNAGQFEAPDNDYGKKYMLPNGVTMDTDIPRQQDGQYVTFDPSGRGEAAQVSLTDQLGRKVQVACASATELFRIVPPGEVSP